MPGTAKKQIESTSSTQFAAANPNLITEHINPLYNYSPDAEQEEDILEMPSPWAGIRENADKRVADARERREAADQEQDIEINRIEHSNQLKEFNKKESQKIKKDAERKRVNKKIEKHRGPSRFSSKIGRFRDGIKHAVKGAQSQKSAGFVAGNLVIADAAALTYYDDIAAKEINDGIVYPSQMNRQPSTLEIFKKSFSNKFNWAATRPAKTFEEKAKRDAKQSKTNDNQNKGDVLLIQQYFKMSKGLGGNSEEKIKDEQKIEDLYKFSKLRKFDITQRTKKELQKQEKLESDKRIIPIISGEGILNATRDAIGGKIVQIMTLGSRKGGSSSDARGIRGGVDFEVGEDQDGNLDFKKIAAKKIKSGILIPPSKTITQQLTDIDKKWDSKIAIAKQTNNSAAFFIHFSSLLEAFQGVMKIGSTVLTTISYYLKGLVAIAPLSGIILGPIIILIKGVTGIMGIIDKIITGVRAIFDGIAMFLNGNPALFSLLQGETINSVASSASAGASFGLEGASKQIKIGGTDQNKEYRADKAMLGSTYGTEDGKSGERDFLGNMVQERVGQSNEDFALEQLASLGASIGSTLVTDVAIPELTKYTNLSAAQAGETHQTGFGHGKKGSGPKPTDGTYSRQIDFERGEEKLALKALELANEEGMQGKSKLSIKVNDSKLNAIDNSKDASSANVNNESSESSAKNRENLKRSGGAWSIAKNILIKSKREFNNVAGQ